MRMLLALTLATISATPALAADAASMPMAAPAAIGATRLSIDTPLETLMADPMCKAVVDANFPGMAAHPMYEQFKTMSLMQLAPMSGGKITEAALAKAKAELAALK